jgi:hypothetical protein
MRCWCFPPHWPISNLSEVTLFSDLRGLTFPSEKLTRQSDQGSVVQLTLASERRC